jgi:hypothetical protein
MLCEDEQSLIEIWVSEWLVWFDEISTITWMGTEKTDHAHTMVWWIGDNPNSKISLQKEDRELHLLHQARTNEFILEDRYLYHLRAWHFVEHVAGSRGNIVYF